MTVCLAGVAAGGRAIVMMADRMITYGESTFEGDVAIPKMRGLTTRADLPAFGWFCMFAGDPTIADEVVDRVRRSFDDRTKAPTAREAMETVQKEYAFVRDEQAEREVLGSRLLTRKQWAERSKNDAPLDPALVEKIDKDLMEYDLCLSLLVVGFDEYGRGTIFSISAPEQVESHVMEGFGTIGAGDNAADSQLIFRGFFSNVDVDEVLYELFEAKARSEIVPGVGYDFDAWVLVPNKPPVEVPNEIIKLLDDVFDYHTRLPFRPRAIWKVNDPEWKRAKRPRKTWEADLLAFTSQFGGGGAS
jgi:hypothetical protein